MFCIHLGTAKGWRSESKVGSELGLLRLGLVHVWPKCGNRERVAPDPEGNSSTAAGASDLSAPRNRPVLPVLKNIRTACIRV